MPGRSQQKDRELKRAAQSCSKITESFKKSKCNQRSESATSSQTNVEEVSGKQTTLFFLN